MADLFAGATTGQGDPWESKYRDKCPGCERRPECPQYVMFETIYGSQPKPRE